RQPTGTYWFMAISSVIGLLLIRQVDRSGLGLSLRAISDAPERAMLSGLTAWPRQVLIFAIAGAFAGLAGGLHALLKGSVFPNDLGIPLSVDALAMLLLGGIGHVTGPIIGAALFFGIKVGFQIIDFWRFILGALIILTCVIAPGGAASAIAALRAYIVREPRR
ncbi:MAG: ABC transporter permease, partial [Pseudomonadota bacterium]